MSAEFERLVSAGNQFALTNGPSMNEGVLKRDTSSSRTPDWDTRTVTHSLTYDGGNPCCGGGTRIEPVVYGMMKYS